MGDLPKVEWAEGRKSSILTTFESTHGRHLLVLHLYTQGHTIGCWKSSVSYRQFPSQVSLAHV